MAYTAERLADALDHQAEILLAAGLENIGADAKREAEHLRLLALLKS